MKKERGLRFRFGRALRDLRREKGFTQETFAHHAGIDGSYEGRVERGEVRVSLEVAEIIAVGLGIRLSELLVHAENGHNGS